MKTAELRAATVDDRRRVSLPAEIPPGSAVTFQRIDADTWVIKRQRRDHGYVFVMVATVQNLRTDPEWEKIEGVFARAAMQGLTEPKE